MTKAVHIIGVALVALALMALPALAVTSHTNDEASHKSPGTFQVLLIAAGALGIIGAVTVTYTYPVASTVPPTAAEASRVPAVVARIEWLDADTSALFTHNFGIATAAGFAGLQPNIAQGFPEVIGPNYTSVSTVVATILYANTSGNVITFTKASLLGTAGSFIITVRKPHSLGL